MKHRTQDEIVARIEERKDRDLFGFEWPFYAEALDFERAKPYLKDGVTAGDWIQKGDHEIRAEAIDYMAFAWDKANNCRGLSAGRSLSHYIAWLWLLGDDALWPTLEDYQYYGKDELRRICEYFGLDADQWDDGIRVNSEDDLWGDDL